MPENHLDDYDTKHLASLMEQQKLVQAKIQAFSEYLTPKYALQAEDAIAPDGTIMRKAKNDAQSA